MLDLEQIDHSSLQEIAYERICESLRRGTYHPGASLPTRTIAKALGISTTPVREALARLVTQHVLAVNPVNGVAYIPVITRERLSEIFELRAMLEGLAAEHAAERITDEELVEIEHLWAMLKAVKNPGDWEHHQVSERFQNAVYLTARRPVLFDLIQSVRLRGGLVLGLLAKSRPPGFSIEPQRARILAGLKRRNPAQARDATRAAVLATRDMLLRAMGQ